VWGDPATWTSHGLQWTHLPGVRALIQRRVTGDPAQGLLAWFAQHVGEQARLPFDRVLVLGCGEGRIERELVSQGIAREMLAFDLSAKVLDEARSRAPAGSPITYAQADMNGLPVGTPPFDAGGFDAAFGVSSIHHCADLDALFGALRRLLKPGGWLFADEYVGPDRFQFSASHMRHAERLAALLPPARMTTRTGAVRRGFRAPTVDEVVALDASEAVHSSGIAAALARHFRIERWRPYGGALLHVLLADVAQNFEDEEGRAWLAAVMRAEDDLQAQGLLEDHFACAIARAPAATGSTAAWSSARNRAGS
jgi:SAM-dependent methyltransferase